VSKAGCVHTVRRSRPSTPSAKGKGGAAGGAGGAGWGDSPAVHAICLCLLNEPDVHHLRCSNKLAKARGTFKALMTEQWKDNCPKPWLYETVPGTCANMMACRAYKYLNFYNMSHWAPNVEVSVSSLGGTI
jgi:hypothetical protein